jgi:hypothetical protein
LFKGSSKLLICGGINVYISTDTCEGINLASSASTCKNPPNFPAKVHLAIGGLGFKGNPILCGGEQTNAYSKKCYSLENNKWVSSASMNSVRVGAAAAQLQDGKLLVTGGYVSYGSSLKGAEILTEDGWESNIPSLPVTIYGHCMVTVNSTTVMAIGGTQNDQYSGKTFYFTTGAKSWTEGPEMKYNRTGHSCGRIRRNKDSQGTSIIVVGGYNDKLQRIVSSVEILNEGSNEWQRGPELPLSIWFSQMVEDPNGGVVLIGGYSPSDVILDTLYHLPHGGQDAVWTKMEQKMKTGRQEHTAFLVPDDVVDCS